ncbi:MAG: hypothetical protein QM536_07595 [Chitinophagaceae bacterium]|nr:hypothetical protein [Chitinophagaceae bacterium]
MENLFYTILTIHILGGGIGLLTGTLIMINKKGNSLHKTIGKIFAYGMISAGFSGIIMSLLHPDYFLFIIGIFTLYLVGTGKRFIFLTMLHTGQKPYIIDWIMTYTMLITGLVFIILGMYHLLEYNIFGIVFIVFGAVGLLSSIQDIKHYKGIIKQKKYWLSIHIQRMVGAYIASLTAFLVVNIHNIPVEIPSFIVWLLPTTLFVPFIFFWIKKYVGKKITSQ